MNHQILEITKRMQIKDSSFVKPKAQDHACTMCGNPVTGEDEETYHKWRRCCRCQFELDTDSGQICVLSYPRCALSAEESLADRKTGTP